MTTQTLPRTGRRDIGIRHDLIAALLSVRPTFKRIVKRMTDAEIRDEIEAYFANRAAA